MPIIPRDVADCRKLIQQHREEIMRGVYDIQFGFDQALSATDLLFLAQHCKSARDKLKYDPRTPTNILEALAKDAGREVRVGVAGNPSTPAATLLDILAGKAGEGVERIRAVVAANPNTPVPTLDILARDGDYHVRVGVAYNRSTPAATLDILAQDKDRNVRSTVAANPSTRKNTIKQLTRDADESVRGYAKINPNKPGWFW